MFLLVTSLDFDLTPFITALTSSITPGMIIALLASIIGICMGFVLLWLGVRKIINIYETVIYGRQMKLEEIEEGKRQEHWAKYHEII